MRMLLEQAARRKSADDEPVGDRPTVLPVPGEFDVGDPLSVRLALGSVVSVPRFARRSPFADSPGRLPGALDETRLLFDYLRGDYKAAFEDARPARCLAGFG